MLLSPLFSSHSLSGFWIVIGRRGVKDNTSRRNPRFLLDEILIFDTKHNKSLTQDPPNCASYLDIHDYKRWKGFHFACYQKLQSDVQIWYIMNNVKPRELSRKCIAMSLVFKNKIGSITSNV